MQASVKRQSDARTIRLANQDDIPVIAELAGRIWRAHYPGIITHNQIDYMLGIIYSHETLAEQIVHPKGKFFVIENANTLAGFLFLEQQSERHFYIHKLYVDATQHSKGLGNALMDEAFAVVGKNATVRLNVNRHNFKAVNFYFKKGFMIEGIEDKDFGQGYFMNDFQMIAQR